MRAVSVETELLIASGTAESLIALNSGIAVPAPYVTRIRSKHHPTVTGGAECGLQEAHQVGGYVPPRRCAVKRATAIEIRQSKADSRHWLCGGFGAPLPRRIGILEYSAAGLRLAKRGAGSSSRSILLIMLKLCLVVVLSSWALVCRARFSSVDAAPEDALVLEAREAFPVPGCRRMALSTVGPNLKYP